MTQTTIKLEADDVAESIQELTLEKKPKARKAQTEEEYDEQKQEFLISGPRINTSDWLYQEDRLSTLDNSKKTDRVHMLHACEKAYFVKDYLKCLSLISQAEVLFGVELEEADKIKEDFSNSGRKTKKSSKVERHVVELLHIKEACIKKMG